MAGNAASARLMTVFGALAGIPIPPATRASRSVSPVAGRLLGGSKIGPPCKDGDMFQGGKPITVKNPGKPWKTAGSGGFGKIHKFLSLYPIRGMRRPFTLVDNAARKFARGHIRTPGVRRTRGR